MRFAPQEESLIIVLNDDTPLEFQVLDNTSVAVSISGCIFSFIVYQSKIDSTPILTLTTANSEISATDVPNGIAQVDLTLELRSILLVRSYYYRLFMQENSGVDTLLKYGTLIVTA